MCKSRGSVEAIKEVVNMGTRISVDEMASIAKIAEAAGGYLASVDPDDDWCGNGRLPIPWPPKRQEMFFKLLDRLVDLRINYEVLINGIPAPEEIVIQVTRRQFGR